MSMPSSTWVSLSNASEHDDDGAIAYLGIRVECQDMKATRVHIEKKIAIADTETESCTRTISKVIKMKDIWNQPTIRNSFGEEKCKTLPIPGPLVNTPRGILAGERNPVKSICRMEYCDERAEE
jgi:hypothetical protein